LGRLADLNVALCDEKEFVDLGAGLVDVLTVMVAARVQVQNQFVREADFQVFKEVVEVREKGFEELLHELRLHAGPETLVEVVAFDKAVEVFYERVGERGVHLLIESGRDMPRFVAALEVVHPAVDVLVRLLGVHLRDVVDHEHNDGHHGDGCELE
jgi:hypothetical protein